MTSTHEAERSAELEAASARAIALLESAPSDAETAAGEACALAERLGDRERLGENLFVRGSARLRLARYAGAEADLRRALDLARDGNGSSLTLRCLRKLLQIAFFTRNWDAAVLRGLQSLQIARDSGERQAEAEAHNDLGLVYGNLGEFEGALEHLLAGLRILRDSGSTKLGSLLNNIGNVYVELGDHREALASFHSALEAFRSEGGGVGVAIALGNIGRASAALNLHEEAVDWFEQSLSGFEGAGETRYRAPALARRAASLAALGRAEEAESAFASAFSVLDSSEVREFEDEVLVAAAHFEVSRSRYHDSVALLHRALRLLPAGETTRRMYEIHHALADAYERLGDAPAALAAYKEYQRVRQGVSDSAMAVRVRRLMLQFDVEQARQQEEIYRLKNVELAQANVELHDLQEQLTAQNRQLHQISIEDPLTGVHNRRYLELQLPVEISRALRHGRPLSIVMGDLDHFKSINDLYSHALGDDVLRRVGSILRDTARIADVVTRYGGEEFLLILPDTDVAGAEVLAERMRAALVAHRWDEVAPDLKVTMSFGIAQLRARSSEAELLADADARLYEAKRSGRNRIVA